MPRGRGTTVRPRRQDGRRCRSLRRSATRSSDSFEKAPIDVGGAVARRTPAARTARARYLPRHMAQRAPRVSRVALEVALRAARGATSEWRRIEFRDVATLI